MNTKKLCCALKSSRIEALLLPSPSQGEKNAMCIPDEQIKCLFCNFLFAVDDKANYIKHLLVEHKFVIADVTLIADFKSYIEYWQNRFLESSVTEFCSLIKKNPFETDKEQNESYYLLCDALPEDKDVREKLQQQRLKDVLHQLHLERVDRYFSRGCLFCKKQFENKAEFFTHLTSDHNFHIGAPDNIVFAKELLDILESKVKNLQCLYCEKIFKDWFALKEHMRKKQHKRINPRNTTYDKFYVVNYLELGKNWEAVLNDEDLYLEGNEEDDWKDWEEEMPGATCLFCSLSSSDYESLLLHMKDSHGFDLHKLKEKLHLGFYQKVKLVNYIRKQVHYLSCISCDEKFHSRNELLNHMSAAGHLSEILDNGKWDQPEYYFPTYENDILLCTLDDSSDDDNTENPSYIPLVLPEDKEPSQDCFLRDKNLRQSLLL